MPSNRSRRRYRAAILLGFATVAAIAACGGDDDAADGTTSAAPSASAAGTSIDDGSTPGSSGSSTPDASAPAYDSEATITYAAAADIANFDPHRSAAGGTIVEYGTLIYAGLTDIDAAGTPIPDLATSWEFVDEAGSAILRMELREGVTFHDGEPFDAAAVKANLDRAKTIEGSTVAAILAPIEEVVVTGPLSVDLVLTAVDVSLPAAFAHQAGRMLSPASFDDPTIDQHPVSAGPYRVTQYLAGDQIQMERFDEYWDAASMEGAPRHFVYRIMPDATARLAALRTGQVDAASLSPAQVTEAEASGLDVHVNPGLGYYVIWLNSSREQFQDVRVRQAMNIAIDREAITDSVLFGHGIPTIQPFPPGYLAHNPDYPVDYYGYDPDRARDLLAEAGVPDGVTIEFMSFQLSPHIDIAQAVQAYWAAVGIDAEIRIVDTAQVAVLFFGEKQSDVMLSTLGARPDPSMAIGYQFTSEGFGNPGGQSTPEIEELYIESLRETDPERRAEVLRANVAEVVEQAFQVPIAAASYNYGLADDMTGFAGRAEGYIDLRDLRKRAG